MSWLKQLFIPHEGNSYRPDVLERFAMGSMLVLVLLSFAMANLQALFWISSEWLVSTILPAVIVDRTNDERDHDKLAVLMRSERLDEAARLKAEDMAAHEYFAHYSPTGVSPWYWFDRVGYDYLHAGENLAVHFTESEAVVEAWMDSPTHRANILNNDYTEIGVGSARGTYNGHPTVFVVQLFGTERIAPVKNPTAAPLANNTTEIQVERVIVSPNEADVAPAALVIDTVTTAEDVSSSRSEPIHAERVTGQEKTPAPVAPATTSRAGEPRSVTPTHASVDDVSFTVRGATEPRMFLEFFYGLLAVLIVGSLLASLAYEVRKHHVAQTVYAGGLLAVMALLLYIHAALTGFVIIA